MIDTSSKPAEQAKVDDENKEDAQGFTEADRQAIDDQADLKFNNELQSIF